RVAQIMSKEDGTNVEVKNNLNIGLALTIDPFIKIILSSESHKQVIQEILELNDLEETNVRNRCTVLCLKGESMKVAAAVIEALKDEVDNYVNQFLSMMAFFQQGFITMLDQLLGVVSTVPGLSEAQMSDKEKISLLRKIYSELIRQIQESGLQNISFVPDGEMETWDVDKLSSELQTMIKELKTEAHKDPLIDLRNVFIQQIRYLRQQNIGEELPIPTEEEIATYDQGELILRYKEFRQQVDLRDIITKLMINSLETEWQFFLTGVIEKSIEEARTKAFLTRTDADTLVVSEVFQAFDELQKSFLNTVILNLLTKWGYFTAITSRVYLEAFLINDQTRDAVTTFFPTISLD
ncbi:MAG TPA: hypothetical protein PLM16_01830, partial [Candidatus Woesebacteria bacterium]|nr:hypothetical protein [Candidatus Woesebacteria bacterium]